jgi:RNA polymerase sigma factor (sigma-70 family)
MTTAPASRNSIDCSTVATPSDADVAAQLKEHRATAERAVRSVIGSSADEEDLVQEVLTRLVIRLRQPGEITVGAWTWRVAHHLAVDHLRAQRATPMEAASLDRGVGEGLDAHVIGSGLAEAINQGLANLPDRQRDALLAQAELDGGRGGHAIVAANLGVSAKAAESILARARRSLRRELERVGVGEGSWVAGGVAVVRGLRRLVRPKAAAVGAVALAACSVIATSALVLRSPLLGPPATVSTLAPGGSVWVSAVTGATPVTSTRPGTAPAAGGSAAGGSPPTGAEAAGGSPGATRRQSVPSGPDLTTSSEPPLASLPPVAVPTTPQPVVPSVTLPTVTLPTVTLPTVTLPTVTLPAVTLPTVTLPTVTLPAVTLPTVTLPTVTVPPVTLPTVTVPPVTLPTVTVPPVTVPPVTVPSVVLPTVTTPALPLGL